jgi:regulator of nonsense transcripts 3
MSSKATSGKSSSKAVGKASKSSGTGGGGGDERYKVVVRRLPRNLPEAAFWQSVAPWVKENTFTWKTFYPGKTRKGCVCHGLACHGYFVS